MFGDPTLAPKGKKKRAKAITTNARSKTWAAQQGWAAAIVEKWNPWGVKRRADGDGGDGPPGIRQDLFGLIDLIVLRPESDGGIIGVQAVGGSSDRSAHKLKIEENQHLEAWLRSGAKFEVWSWRKRTKDGKPYYELTRYEWVLNAMGIPHELWIPSTSGS